MPIEKQRDVLKFDAIVFERPPASYWYIQNSVGQYKAVHFLLNDRSNFFVWHPYIKQRIVVTSEEDPIHLHEYLFPCWCRHDSWRNTSIGYGLSRRVVVVVCVGETAVSVSVVGIDGMETVSFCEVDLSCQKKLFFRLTFVITAIFAVGRIAEVTTVVGRRGY